LSDGSQGLGIDWKRGWFGGWVSGSFILLIPGKVLVLLLVYFLPDFFNQGEGVISAPDRTLLKLGYL
jgi:hypothetical protein